MHTNKYSMLVIFGMQKTTCVPMDMQYNDHNMTIESLFYKCKMTSLPMQT